MEHFYFFFCVTFQMGSFASSWNDIPSTIITTYWHDCKISIDDVYDDDDDDDDDNNDNDDDCLTRKQILAIIYCATDPLGIDMSTDGMPKSSLYTVA